MIKSTDGFVWTEQAHGDSYILNERSYDCLFRSPDSLLATDRWLDIGAHVGYFAVRIANRVGRVIAVEPEPLNIQHLEENIELNNANVDFIEAAIIPGHERTVELGLGRTFTYTHMVRHVRGRKHIQVLALNINDVIELFSINKIKMDCEGMEAELLAVMDYKPIEEMIFEWHFTLIPDPDWTGLHKAIDRLKAEGFRILRAPQDLAKPTKRWTAIIWAKRT
jgi:FkbM family methyltransferase